jgi:putative copper export protein
MLPVHASTVRLFLHVLAATIWVGGQIVLLAVVPTVRRLSGREGTRATARVFQFVAWPAFVVLLATGVWNLTAVHVADQSSEYLTTLFVKLILVGISGAGALAHTLFIRRSPAIGGIAAGIGLLAAIGAVFCGILLQSG